MSLITDGVRRRLWHDAQIFDEWAATRLWEYIIRRYFDGNEFVVSSQQPPYVDTPTTLRRVDLIVEHVSSVTGYSQTLLFFEAKKHGASRDEVMKCETQAWEAASSYYIQNNLSHAVWYLTAVGTTYRVWIMDPRNESPVPFLPGVFSFENIHDYLDVDDWGRTLIKAFHYIQQHPAPPDKLMEETCPSPTVSSDQAMSSPSPMPEAAAAAARNPIPLREDLWVEATVVHKDASKTISKVGNGETFESLLGDWQPRYKSDGSLCYTYIDPATKFVYWTYTLEPEAPSAWQSPASGAKPSGHQFSFEPGPSGGPSHAQAGRGEGSSSTHGKKLVNVRVRVIEHVTSKDEWQFENARRSRQTTLRTQWKRRPDLNLGSSWVYETGNHIYYTTQQLHNPKV